MCEDIEPTAPRRIHPLTSQGPDDLIACLRQAYRELVNVQDCLARSKALLVDALARAAEPRS